MIGRQLLRLFNLPEFEDQFAESLQQTLNLNSWIPGEDLIEMYGRLEQEIADAVAMEDSYRKTIRKEVFSKIKTSPGAPPNAGVYEAKREDLEQIHTGLLLMEVSKPAMVRVWYMIPFR